MKIYEIHVVEGVPAGKQVYNGYASGICTAPSMEEGPWSLYEQVYENTNTHAGWIWKKEAPTGDALRTYDDLKTEED